MAWRSALVAGAAASALLVGPAAAGGEALSGTPPQGLSAREPGQEPHARLPTRLWYRIEARFSGEQIRVGRDINGVSTTTTLRNDYRLRANTATRVAVNCRGPRVGTRAVSCRELRQDIRRRYRGARRAAMLRGLREGYAFRANMSGRISGGRIVTRAEPITSTSATGERVPCMPADQTTLQLQAGPQVAIGSVSSRGGSRNGVTVEARPRGRSATQLSSTAVTCQSSVPVPPTFTAGGTTELRTGVIWPSLDRDDLSHIAGKPQSEHLRFEGRPGRFGRTFSISRTIREQGPRVGPNGGMDTGSVSRRFRYTLVFKACGRGGRVPRGC